MPKQKLETRKAPRWLIDHFSASLDANERLLQITHLSERGISLIRAVPRAVEVLAEVDGTSQTDKAKTRLERARLEAELANSEVETGYPVLHGFMVVALWSWLESLVKGYVELWIYHNRVSDIAEIKRIRLRVGDFLGLSKREQAALLVEMLEQDQGSALKQGVNHFQSLLEPFSLWAPIGEKHRNAIYELQQVRNLIAHRRGVIDQKFRKNCPWIKNKIGANLLISSKMVANYAEACGALLLALLYRAGDVHGLDLRQSVQDKPLDVAQVATKGEAGL